MANLDIEPTEEDLTLARDLIAQGYKSVSNKYRTIARWRVPLTGRDLVRPEMHDTRAGRILIEKWDQYLSDNCLRDHHPDIENRELTIGQFRAFKQLGGVTA